MIHALNQRLKAQPHRLTVPGVCTTGPLAAAADLAAHLRNALARLDFDELRFSARSLYQLRETAGDIALVQAASLLLDRLGPYGSQPNAGARPALDFLLEILDRGMATCSPSSQAQ